MVDYEKNDYIEFINNLDPLLKREIYNNMGSLDCVRFLGEDENLESGKVLCVPFYEVNNESFNFEVGALILGPNSKIGEHNHEKCFETYTVIEYDEGGISLNSSNRPCGRYFNLCNLIGCHGIKNDTDKFSVVIYHKIYSYR